MALTTRALVLQTLGLTDDATASAAIAVSLKSTTLTSCVFTVNSASTTLTVTPNTGAPTTFTLTAAAYDTLGELATAISALSGLTASIATGLSTSTASTLLTASQSVTITTASDLGQMTYTNAGNGTVAALVDQLITDGSDEICRYCGFDSFDSATYTEKYDGTSTPYILLRHAPVTSITSVSWLDSDGNATAYDSSQYRCNLATGQLDMISNGWGGYGGGWVGAAPSYGNGGTAGYLGPAYNRDFGTAFPRGFQNIQVVYVAGYSVLPAGLKRAATAFVVDMYLNRRTNISMASDAGGGRKTEQSSPTDQWSRRMEQLFANWRRWDAGA